MKKTLTATVGLLIVISTVQAGVIFKADFESSTAANTGTITYNAGNNVLVPVTGGPDATLGSQALLSDPNLVAAATDITLTPTAAAALTGGQSATVAWDVVWRRTNTNNKDHYMTGYDANNSIIFRFVMADVNAFATDGDGLADTAINDRQRPGYATSAGAFAFGANQMASGSVPGTFWWGNDGDSTDGLNPTIDAHIELTVSSSGWVANMLKQDGVTTAITKALPTYSGASFTELAYVRLTGESNAAGAFFDNLTISSIPEPATVGLLAVLSGGILWVRRTFTA